MTNTHKVSSNSDDVSNPRYNFLQGYSTINLTSAALVYTRSLYPTNRHLIWLILGQKSNSIIQLNNYSIGLYTISVFNESSSYLVNPCQKSNSIIELNQPSSALYTRPLHQRNRQIWLILGLKSAMVYDNNPAYPVNPFFLLTGDELPVPPEELA